MAQDCMAMHGCHKVLHVWDLQPFCHPKLHSTVMLFMVGAVVLLEPENIALAVYQLMLAVARRWVTNMLHIG